FRSLARASLLLAGVVLVSCECGIDGADAGADIADAGGERDASAAPDAGWGDGGADDAGSAHDDGGEHSGHDDGGRKDAGVLGDAGSVEDGGDEDGDGQALCGDTSVYLPGGALDDSVAVSVNALLAE